jgi:hypothetical protein
MIYYNNLNNNMTEQLIKNIFNQLHSRFKNTNILDDDIKSIDYCYVSTHDTCSKINDIFEIMLDNKLTISENFINRYFKIICSSIECWSNNYDKNLAHILYIFENINLTDKNIKYIIDTGNAEIIHMFINNYKNINFNIIKKISDNKEYYNITHEYILKNNNQEYLNLLLENAIKQFDFQSIEKMLDNKINVTQDLFVKIIRISFNIKNGLDLVKKCILNGGRIEKNTLDLSIYEYINTYNGYYDRYSRYYSCSIYDMDKIIMFLFENGSTDITISKILTLNIHKVNQELINYLVDNNIVITKEDFIKLCNDKIKINNIKKIEHFFDDIDVQSVLYNSNTFLKYPIKVKYNIEMLKKELKSGVTARIKEILKEVKPTQECLEIACGTNNMSIIQILHDTYNLKFNEKCILNHSYNLRYNTLLQYVRNKYIELNNINLNNNDNNNNNNDFVVNINNLSDSESDS